MGLVLTVVWVALQSLLDSTIRSEEDIACCCDFPILAAIPDRMRDCCDKHTGAPDKRSDQVGRTVPFAAVEAYKLLRTKLHFIFADQDGCSVIGVTSSLPGEGKSITSLNLAYSMSCLSKRVLLLECDMRCPSLAEKLSLRKTPGLSEFLCGQIQADKLLQLCGETGNTQAFHFISAGRIPPNPIELLSSRRMQKIMEPLRQRYDYIILDMPSVIETADALEAAKLTDGMLMVVCRDCCDRVAFRSAIGQLSFMNARILGIVFNCASEDNVWRRSLKKHMRREARGKEVSGDLRFPQGNRTGNGEYSSSGGE